MSHVSNKNIKLSRLLPLFKEKSSIYDQVTTKFPVSALSEQQSGSKWEKDELGDFIISKNLPRDFSKPITSSDTENMAHPYDEAAPYSFPALLSKNFPRLSPMTAEEREFWDPRSNKSDRRILGSVDSTEPALPSERKRETGLSRWQKIKKQFKKCKGAFSCTSENSVSQECSSVMSPMTQITEPSSLLSTSIATMVSKSVFPLNRTDSHTNGEHPETETEEVAEVKTEKNDSNEGPGVLKTRGSTSKPAEAFKRSFAEKSLEDITSVMECSEPNLSVSSIGKYWDNHPISRSCRNIFRANKPVWEETIIHRPSPWKVLRNQGLFSEKQRRIKILNASKVTMSI